MPKNRVTFSRRLAADRFLLLALGLLATAATYGGQPRRPPLELTDKTLVAWVSLADTTQRGGSALTLMEGEDFDALVFGERVPGRWMAGSDFFRRTQGEAEQQANVAETAGADRLVQIATAWTGDRVAIYHNGQPYASYRIAKPRAFGPDTAVLLGLRYLGGMGPIGFLRGAIDEARIYNRALDGPALAALRPNQPSTPPPLAQRTFEDGTASDGVHWEALEPPSFLDGAPHGEAGAVERIGQKYYLLLGSGGMKTLVADQPQGPFRPAQKNFTLLQGGPTYFARFFPTNPDGLLVNHHAIAKNGRIHLGLLKRAVTDDELTLRLGWWNGNERLKHEAIPIQLARGAVPDAPLVMLDGELPVDDGVILEGILPIPADANSPGAGLYVETASSGGTGILVRHGGLTEFGSLQVNGTDFKGGLRANREMRFGSIARFRLALKGWLLEFYLDDILMECYSLPSRATGRMGLVGGTDRPTNLRAWR